jgi:hypothetical protein
MFQGEDHKQPTVENGDTAAAFPRGVPEFREIAIAVTV